MAGAHGVSKRGLEEITEAVFDAPLSVGTVSNLEQEMSAALEAPHVSSVLAWGQNCAVARARARRQDRGPGRALS